MDLFHTIVGTSAPPIAMVTETFSEVIVTPEDSSKNHESNDEE